MSSGLLEPLRRNIGLRLSLLYALDLHALSSVALLALAYYLLAAAVGSQGPRGARSPAQGSRRSCTRPAGSARSQDWVSNQPEQVQNTMFVRLVNPDSQYRPHHQRAAGLGGLQGRAGLGRPAPDALHPHPARTRSAITPWAASNCPTAGCCRLAGPPTAAKPS